MAWRRRDRHTNARCNVVTFQFPQMYAFPRFTLFLSLYQFHFVFGTEFPSIWSGYTQLRRGNDQQPVINRDEAPNCVLPEGKYEILSDGGFLQVGSEGKLTVFRTRRAPETKLTVLPTRRTWRLTKSTQDRSYFFQTEHENVLYGLTAALTLRPWSSLHRSRETERTIGRFAFFDCQEVGGQGKYVAAMREVRTGKYLKSQGLGMPTTYGHHVKMWAFQRLPEPEPYFFSAKDPYYKRFEASPALPNDDYPLVRTRAFPLPQFLNEEDPK